MLPTAATNPKLPFEHILSPEFAGYAGSVSKEQLEYVDRLAEIRILANKMQELQEKMFKVLRVRKRLNDRRNNCLWIIKKIADGENAEYILKQRNLLNPADALTSSLRSLIEINDLEQRGLGYCAKGLYDLQKILIDLGYEMRNDQSFFERVQFKLSKKWKSLRGAPGIHRMPYLGKKISDYEKATELAKTLGNSIHDLITFFSGLVMDLEKNKLHQGEAIRNLYKELAQVNYIHIDLRKNPQYLLILAYQKEEISLLKGLKRTARLKSVKMISDRLWEMVKNNKVLSMIQIPLFAPWVTPAQIAVLGIFGWWAMMLFWLTAQPIKYSPMLVIMFLEKEKSLQVFKDYVSSI